MSFYQWIDPNEQSQRGWKLVCVSKLLLFVNAEVLADIDYTDSEHSIWQDAEAYSISKGQEQKWN